MLILHENVIFFLRMEIGEINQRSMSVFMDSCACVSREEEGIMGAFSHIWNASRKSKLKQRQIGFDEEIINCRRGHHHADNM